MYKESHYMCPLVEREMWDAECYDVQMVHYGFIAPRILDFTFDKDKSDTVCETCPFNQLKQSASTAGKTATA
ncbi:MAG: hypothetical protein FWG31_06630 [Oscillospiraceae bacterium]|nr:hypothetical protein [Oscillospiraceae bacterium]